MASCSSSALRSLSPASRSIWSSDAAHPPLGGAPSCVTMHPTSPPWPVRGPNHWLRPALCPCHRSTGAPTTCLDQRHTTSDRGMDYTPGHRGPWDEAPRYLIRDRDRAYGAAFTHRLRAIGIRDKPIAPGSPWQNGFAERLIGSIRRECVDHIVVLGVRSISPCVDFWRRIRRMCAFRCGSTGHPLKSNTHLQSFACTGGRRCRDPSFICSSFWLPHLRRAQQQLPISR